MASSLAPSKARRGIPRLGTVTHAEINNTFVLLLSVNSRQTFGSNSSILSGTAQAEPNTMCSCEEKILVLKTQGHPRKLKTRALAKFRYSRRRKKKWWMLCRLLSQKQVGEPFSQYQNREKKLSKGMPRDT